MSDEATALIVSEQVKKAMEAVGCHVAVHGCDVTPGQERSRFSAAALVWDRP